MNHLAWIDRFNRWLHIRMQSTPHTRRCVICGAPASCFTGHVMLWPFWIIAGWCDSHRNSGYWFRFGRMGCHGLWWPRYGLWFQPWKMTP